MAKKGRGRPKGSRNKTISRGAPESIGTALGNVAARLDGWLSQRDVITKELNNVIERARGMLSQLGSLEVSIPRRRGRPPATTTAPRGRKRKRMSKAARAKISAAQKARWAKQKKNA